MSTDNSAIERRPAKLCEGYAGVVRVERGRVQMKGLTDRG